MNSKPNRVRGDEFRCPTCGHLPEVIEVDENGNVTAPGVQPEARAAQAPGFAEWWVCFRCWQAYHVPTTGYYGRCQDCGYDTQRWPADPTETLRLIEWRRPSKAAPAPFAGEPALPPYVSLVRREKGGVQIEGHTRKQDWELEVDECGNVVSYSNIDDHPDGCTIDRGTGSDSRVPAPPAGETQLPGLPIPVAVTDAEVIAAVRGVLWEAMRGRDIGGDRTLVGMVKRLVAERDEAQGNRRGEFDLRMEAEAELRRLAPAGETAPLGELVERAKETVKFLRSVPAWAEDDWQGVKYHALAVADDLASALRTAADKE